MKIGSLILPNCGHDAGRFYMVCDLKEPYAFLCDGEKRDLAHTKKKLMKHCVLVGCIPQAQELLEQIRTLEPGPQRAAIRKAIRRVNTQVVDSQQG